MKFVRFGDPGQEKPGVLTSPDVIVDLSESPDGLDHEAMSLDWLDRVRQSVDSQRSRLPQVDPATVRVGSPISRPGKIICVGLNYREHAVEAGLPIPDEPVLFLKAPYTVVGPNDDVVIPKGSLKTDYEVELAVVIGATAEYLDSPDDSRSHILGYTISNDVSERAYQLERGGQWDKGKNCATFNPLGPWLVTADEIAEPQQLRLTSLVNGEVRQDSSTADMIFPIDYLVWYISQFMTLLPGDIINTGTPQGVGAGFTPGRFLSDEDVVDIRIEGMGSQRQTFRDYGRLA